MEEYFESILGSMITEETVEPPSMKWKTVKPEEYQRIYAESIRDPVEFWSRMALKLEWSTLWESVIEGRPPSVAWFKGGRLNVYGNIMGRHRDTLLWGKTALLWEGEEGEARAITYRELDSLVNRIAGGIRAQGVRPGEWIIIYAPPLVESIAVMLAAVKLGIPFEPVFTGFGYWELAKRIKSRRARLVFTADGFYRRGRTINTLEIARRAVEYSKFNGTLVVIERTGPPSLRSGEVLLDDLAGRERAVDDYIAESTHPLFGLHSGYEEDYKPVTYPAGGFLVQVYSTSMWIGLRPRDTYFCTVWPGWITGVSYLVFGPLMIGSTILLYDGGPDYPDWGRWWSLIEDYAVTLFLTTSGALRIARKQGDSYVKAHNTDTLRAILVTAEPLEADAWWWAYRVVGTGSTPIIDSNPAAATGRIPVVNLYIQSEIGSFVTGNLVNYTFPPLKPGSSGPPIPGFHLGVLNRDGVVVDHGLGELVVRNPWPSMPIEYPEEYSAKWVEGYYKTGDYAYISSDGYTYIAGRLDRVFKSNGYRLSPGAIVRVLKEILNLDAAVYACLDDQRLEAPVIVYSGSMDPEVVRNTIRSSIGAISDPKIVKQAVSLGVLKGVHAKRKLCDPS
ncbi:MAG: AMP-binding protein [Desulfurococcus sp.]|nr:AMP-binding protein [Desulfurococcus sp.]